MGKAMSKLGWLIFILALIGAALRTGPDDPITADLKSSGMYQPYLVIMAGFISLALIYATLVVRKSAKMRRGLMYSKGKAGKPCSDFYDEK